MEVPGSLEAIILLMFAFVVLIRNENNSCAWKNVTGTMWDFLISDLLKE